ncbi:MAG TPA: hypothetical protein VF956_01965 [Candidatus Dormibacteraeota bacterium]
MPYSHLLVRASLLSGRTQMPANRLVALMAVRLVGALVIVIVLALLWLMPSVLFSHPGVNDAIELSSFGPLLYLITLGAGLLSLVGVGRLGWRTSGPIGLGVFLLGLAAAFVLAILAFGNFSNDRFLALYVTPVLGVPVGIALIVAGFAMPSRQRKNPVSGALIGLAAAVILAAWLLVRGATDWLQAPYGFDIYVVIAVAAATVFYVGAAGRSAIDVHA